MRTKALLVGAMIGAASLVTSMAQVYSVNIVGYVNTTIPHNFCIIHNPLNASPDNTLGSVIPTPAQSITVYKFRPTTGDFAIDTYDTEFGWDDAALAIAPGEAFFVYNAGTAFTITFVGEVATGPTSIPLQVGFNMVGSKVPQAGLLQTDLKYAPSPAGEQIYVYKPATGDYDIYGYDPDFGWDPEPNIPVGIGFWAYRSATGSWDRNFSVGP